MMSQSLAQLLCCQHYGLFLNFRQRDVPLSLSSLMLGVPLYLRLRIRLVRDVCVGRVAVVETQTTSQAGRPVRPLIFDELDLLALLEGDVGDAGEKVVVFGLQRIAQTRDGQCPVSDDGTPLGLRLQQAPGVAASDLGARLGRQQQGIQSREQALRRRVGVE